MANVKAGDKVSWKSHGGTAEGKVVKKVTSKTHIKGHTVDASKTTRNMSSRPTRGRKPRTSRAR